jgi:Large ribosomal RNA subunit accumulation protein YceD
MPPDPPPEFSRPLPLRLIGPEGRREVVEASETECAALARRFGIPGVERLRAELLLRPDVDGAVRAEGRLYAAVVQACVVTLEPVEQQIDETVALRFLPEGREPQDEPDQTDEIATRHGIADLGEAMAEQLALALDPYPRAPDAALPAGSADAGSATAEHPMAALAKPRGGGRH